MHTREGLPIGLFGKKEEKKKRILVVEDDTNIRNIIKFLLANKGYEVLESGDGKQAFDMARTQAPDLILLDVMLPGMTGIDICAQLKNNPKYDWIPIMMLTATTQGSMKSDEFWKTKSRADDFITKPFKSADLLARVEKIIAESWRKRGDGQTVYKI